MPDHLAPDLCIIGSGAAGAAAAARAAALGVATALIEMAAFGGDLSPVALRAFAAAARRGDGDYTKAREAAAAAQAAARAAASAARWRAAQVAVLRGQARFTSPQEVEAGGARLRARRFIVATGATPVMPNIPGLEQIRAETPQTILDRAEQPQRLVVLGAGARALELALAYRKLGSEALVIDPAGALAQEDPEFSALAARGLRRAGVALRDDAPILRCEAAGDGFRLHLEGGETIEGDVLLAATARRPRLGGLGLEAAGVALTPQGAALRPNLRTSNRRIFIAGGAAGAGTIQAAQYQARIALQAALFRWPARVDPDIPARFAAIEPDYAAVGLTEAQARKAYGRLRLQRLPLHCGGHVKLIFARSGRLVGAAVLGAGAAEAIGLLQLAIQRGLRAPALAELAAPAGTAGETVAAAAQAAALQGSGSLSRGLLGALRKFG